MAKSKNTDLATTPKNVALAPLEDWEQDLAGQAKDDVAKEQQGIPRISHKSGVLQVEGKPVAGGKIQLVVVDYGFEKCFYAGEYDPNAHQTPACYAFGKDEQSLTPHEAAPDKQAEACAGCKWNAFGTAEKGRGKRCKDVRRLLCAVPTGGPDDLAKGEIRMMSIPPGSLKDWARYLLAVPDIDPRTRNVRCLVTEVGTVPLPNGGHGLTFRAIDRLAPEQIKALQQRAKELESQLFGAYPVISEEEKPAAPARGKSRKF
jgi:hypothetical protein